jgi:hypothetical protein
MARDFYSNWAEEPPVETVLMDSYRLGEAGEAAAGFCLMASSPITRAKIQRKGDREKGNNRKIDLPVLYSISRHLRVPVLYALPCLCSLSYIPYPPSVLLILCFLLCLCFCLVFRTPSVLPILYSLPSPCSLSYIPYPLCTTYLTFPTLPVFPILYSLPCLCSLSCVPYQFPVFSSFWYALLPYFPPSVLYLISLRPTLFCAIHSLCIEVLPILCPYPVCAPSFLYSLPFVMLSLLIPHSCPVLYSFMPRPFSLLSFLMMCFLSCFLTISVLPVSCILYPVSLWYALYPSSPSSSSAPPPLCSIIPYAVLPMTFPYLVLCSLSCASFPELVYMYLCFAPSPVLVSLSWFPCVLLSLLRWFP